MTTLQKQIYGFLASLSTLKNLLILLVHLTLFFCPKFSINVLIEDLLIFCKSVLVLIIPFSSLIRNTFLCLFLLLKIENYLPVILIKYRFAIFHISSKKKKSDTSSKLTAAALRRSLQSRIRQWSDNYKRNLSLFF